MPGSTAANRVLQVLIAGEDAAVAAEVDAAVSALPSYRVLSHTARTHAQALEIARARQPQLVLVDVPEDVGVLAGFARDLRADVPGAVIAGLFFEDRLGSRTGDGALLIQAIRAGLQDFLRRPVSTAELRQLLDRTAASDARPFRPHGTVVTFISNKGGIGKSTLSVNTACLLAERHPGRVLLVDASLQLGVCAMLLDVEPSTSLVDAARQRDRLDETLITQLAVEHGSGLRLLAAPADAVQAAEIDDEVMARVLTRARQTFDFVVVDTFPMLDEVVMSVLDLADLGFIVSQATVPSVVGTARLLPVLEAIGFGPERQRLVLNHNHRSFAGALSAADIASRLGREIDYDVPYDRQVLASVNTGVPQALKASRRFGFGRVLSGIADAVEDQAEALRHAPDGEAPLREAGADGTRP